jgi:hypothetical protein
MSMHEVRVTALMMIRSYGAQAQAQAIAETHANEARGRSDPSELNRWRQIQAAICEMRRTGARVDQHQAA